MSKSSVGDLLFIRLQSSILCRNVVHEEGTTSLVDWLYGIERTDSSSFYIVHEWCCSMDHLMSCFEEIQLIDPDGEIEANLRMSPFQIGNQFWDTIRNYWAVTEFHPTQAGTHEIRTKLVELNSEQVLYQQTDPLHVF